MFCLDGDQLRLSQQEQIHLRSQTFAVDPFQDTIQSGQTLAAHVETPEVGPQRVISVGLSDCSPQRADLSQLLEGECGLCQGVNQVPDQGIFGPWSVEIRQNSLRQHIEYRLVQSVQDPVGQRPFSAM